MEENQEHKCYICRFCKQSFLNGKKLGGHMRGHLALISATKNKSTKEETINGGIGLEFNDELIKNNEERLGVDEDYGANSYGLRENPKKSWRVSVSVSNSNSNSKPKGTSDSICKQCGKGFNSLRALASHMRSHSLKTKESIKKNLCAKCGKGFDSVKALYGHMRCHAIKKSQPSNESSSSSSSPSPSPSSSSAAAGEEEGGKLDGGVKAEIANPIRRKRSCTRYKSAKPNDPSSCTSLSSFASIGENNDDDVEEGALCLMMLSRGLRDLGGGKILLSSHHQFEVSIGGSKGVFKKEVVCESGSDQPDMDPVKNNPRSNSQRSRDKGKRKAFDDPCDTDVRRSMAHKCPICFKEFGSGQALGGHKKAHYNLISTENSLKEDTDDSFEIHRRVELEGGIKNESIELKLTWVRNDIEWDPLLLIN